MQQVLKNIGAYVKSLAGIAPQSNDLATAVNGADIDRLANATPLSMVLLAHLGALSGAPSALALEFRVQHADDNAGSPGTYADYQIDGANVSISFDETETNTLKELDIDLSGAKRWVRVQITDGSAFTGGTSPEALVAAEYILGGVDTLPT